jgi:predicted dehydrogenase
MRELKIGLVGAGWMGKVHSMSYRTALGAFGPEPAVPVLETIMDSNPALAARAQRDYGYRRLVDDWHAIVEDPSIDIVDICTPNDMHHEVAMAAIAAGKHVYCEKPLANSTALAREMAEAADRRGVTTIVGFNYIKNPVHGLAQKLLREGAIGAIDYVRLYFNCDFMANRNLPHTWRNDVTRAGSGVIGDIGAHLLSYHFHLVAQEIEEVFCMLDTVIPAHPAPMEAGGFQLDAKADRGRMIENTTDDVATVLFKFGGGGRGHLEASRISTGIRYDIGYDIVGSQGTLRYSYDRINDLYVYREEGPPELRGFRRVEMGPSDPAFAAFHPVSGLGLGYNDFKAMEARDMIVAAARGEPAYPDFRWAYRIQRVVDACVKSHAEKRWVKVSEVA